MTLCYPEQNKNSQYHAAMFQENDFGFEKGIRKTIKGIDSFSNQLYVNDHKWTLFLTEINLINHVKCAK